MASLCLTVILLVQSFQTVTQQSICKVYQQTHIDCSSSEFKHVPDNFPEFSTHLDLSWNQINETGSASFEGLTQLRQLNLSSNEIILISGKSFSELQSLEILDLRNNLLEHISENHFSDLKNLKTLILSGNNLTELSPTSFYGLGLLNELYLDGNRISTLPNGIFEDVTELKIINLDKNNLDCFPQTALQALVKIREITLNWNCFLDNCTRMNLKPFHELERLVLTACDMLANAFNEFLPYVPTLQDVMFDDNKAVSFIVQLVKNIFLNRMNSKTQDLVEVLGDLRHSKIKSLHLESLNEITNITFKGLHETSLEKLHISLYPLSSNVVLSPGVFLWLRHLKTISIRVRDLVSIDSRAFNGLDNLTSLILTRDNLSNITEVSQSASNLPKLKYLHLNFNKFSGEIPPNIFVEVSSLVEIDLSYNSFTAIHPDSFTSLPNLITLDLSYNDIHYLPEAAFSFLTSLEALYLKGNDLTNSDHVPNCIHYLVGLKHLKQLSVSIFSPAVLCLEDVPSLEYFHLSGFLKSRQASLFNSDETNAFMFCTLQSANLSKLETIDIEGVQVDTICMSYENNGECQIINKNCLSITNYEPWKNMKTLKLHNSIWSESKKELMALLNLFPNLEELSLKSLHTLEYMDVISDSLAYLQSLDISSNQLTKVNTNLLRSLPNLKTLTIHENPFSCSKCEMESFVKWLKNDKTVFLTEAPKCAIPQYMDDVSVLTLDFGLECNLTVLISVPITCFAFVISLTIVVGIRFRWHIRYLLFMLKLRRGGYQLQVNDEEQPLEKKYDAFVVYNEHDGEWVMQELIPNLENTDQHNFKLCIHERDFVPGDDIFENILNSIENSNKTLLILSPHFAQSEWCYFEMRMAQTQLFEEKKDVILMVMLQEIPDDKIPRVLRKILMTKKYLEWPENDLGRRMFWQKLRMALKSESRVNRIAKV